MNSISNIVRTIGETTNSDYQYICVYDQDFKIVDCCAYYAALNGVGESELLGKSCEAIYSNLSEERRDQFRKVLATGTPSSIAFQFTSTTNEVVYVEEQVSRLNNGLVVVGKDITNRKKKEEQEYALSLIAKHSTQYFLIVDLEGTILFIDKTYRGFKLEDVIGSNISVYNDKESDLKIRKSIAKVVKTKEPSTYETYAYVGEENRMVFEGTIIPIIEDNGDIIKLAITTDGITERKKIENELKTINRQYLNLLELTESVAFTQDKELKFTNILNPTGILNTKSALGKTDRDLIKPFDEEAEILEAIKLEVLQTGKVIRRDIKLNINGEVFHYDLLVQPLFNEKEEITGITCTSINITERITRKEALEKNEIRLNKAEEIAQLGYFEIDVVSGKMNWSMETDRIFGQSTIDSIPHMDNFLDFVHTEDRAIALKELKEIIETGKNVDLTVRVPVKNNRIKYIKNLSQARINEKGETVSVFGTIQDVTQQIGLDIELKEQKTFIQKIMDSSPSLIFILDIDKRENIFLNNVSEKLLGYSKEEVRRNHNLFLNQLSNLKIEAIESNTLTEESTSFLSFIHPAERHLFVEFVHMFVEDTSDKIFDLNFRHQHKNGNWVWLHHRLIAFNRDAKGRVNQLLGIVSDITSIKESEKKSKIAMLEGQEKERQRMAKDLHDAINPLLSAAKLNVESLQYHEHTGNTEPHIKLSNIVSLLGQSMEAIKDISFDLMPSILKDFGLAFTLRDYCNKITEGGLLKINLDIHGVESRLGKIKEIMLFRIAQELINNVIRHANASHVDVQLIAHKKTIILMVEDNGKGMENTANLILTNGYGLKNVESRTKTLNGTMVIDSIEKRGTIITIEIPRK